MEKISTQKPRQEVSREIEDGINEFENDLEINLKEAIINGETNINKVGIGYVEIDGRGVHLFFNGTNGTIETNVFDSAEEAQISFQKPHQGTNSQGNYHKGPIFKLTSDEARALLVGIEEEIKLEEEHEIKCENEGVNNVSNSLPFLGGIANDLERIINEKK